MKISGFTQKWTSDGYGNIHYTDGYVGIGTTTPTALLTLGNVTFSVDGDGKLTIVDSEGSFSPGEVDGYHDQLFGLDADDHPQYLLVDGTRDMTGALTIDRNTHGTHLTLTGDGLFQRTLEIQSGDYENTIEYTGNTLNLRSSAGRVRILRTTTGTTLPSRLDLVNQLAVGPALLGYGNGVLEIEADLVTLDSVFSASLFVTTTEDAALSEATLSFADSGIIEWSSNDSYVGAADVAVERDSAGTLKITDAGAGDGSLLLASLTASGDVNLGINQRLVLDDDADTFWYAISDDRVLLSTGNATRLDITNTGVGLRGDINLDFQESGGVRRARINTNTSDELVFAVTSGNTERLRLSSTQAVLPQENTPATPTLAFGDGDTGLYENADDSLRIAVGGGAAWQFSTNILQGIVGTAPALRNVTSTATTANIHPNWSDTDTGIGTAAADQLSFIAGGIEGLRVTGGGPGQPTVDSYGDFRVHGGGKVVVGDADGTFLTSSPSGQLTIWTEPSQLLSLRPGGSYAGFWSGSLYVSSATFGPFLDMGLNNSTATTPRMGPSRSDLDTGLGTAGADQLSLIAGGVEALRLTTTQALLPQANTPTTPALAFGDANTGFYESADNTLNVAVNGNARWEWQNTFFQSSFAANGPALAGGNSSDTVPNILPSKGDANTGIGRAAADQLSLIAGGVETLRVTSAQAISPQANTPATPAIAFGDGDTGLFEATGNVLQFSFGGSAAWQLAGSNIRSLITGGPRLSSADATSTVPNILPDFGDTNTGLGHAASDELSIIAGGTEVARATVTGLDLFVGPTSGTHATTKDYVDSVAQGLDWQESVLSASLTTPPGLPLDGYRYVVASPASGDWTGEEDSIAEYNGSSWDFTTPNEGFAVFVEDSNLLCIYFDASWMKMGTAIDHGNLVGLSDDDHTQYLLTDGTRASTGTQAFPSGIDLDASGIIYGDRDIRTGLQIRSNADTWEIETDGATSPNITISTTNTAIGDTNILSTGEVGVNRAAVANEMLVIQDTGATTRAFSYRNSGGTETWHATAGGLWRIGAGSATTPAYAFDGDTDTGFYNAVAGRVIFTSETTPAFSMDSGVVQTIGAVPMRSAIGNAGAPGFAFNSDTNTGMFGRTADEIGWSIGGTERLSLSDSGLDSYGSFLVHNLAQTQAYSIRVGDNVFGNNTALAMGIVSDTDITTNIAIRSTGVVELNGTDGTGGIIFSNNGTAVSFYSGGAQIGVQTNGPGIRWSETASATNPTFTPGRSDPNTGVGWASADVLTLIAGGSEALRAVEDSNNTQIIVPQANTPAAPTIAFGDGDTGFLESSDDEIAIAHGGSTWWYFSNGSFTSATTYGAFIRRAAGSNIVPNFSFRSDTDTGIGRAADDQLSLIAGATELMRITTTQALLPLSNTPATPTLAFGDGDTGLYESADDELSVATIGLQRWIYTGNGFRASTPSGPRLQNLVPSATSPVYTFQNDQDTGIGKNAADELSLIAGATELMRITTTQALLPLSNTPATPTLAFGDGDTGFHETKDDEIGVSIAGSTDWAFSLDSGGLFRGAIGSAPWLRNISAAATTPNLGPARGDYDTGLGSSGADELSLIAGGTEVMRVTSTNTTLNTDLTIGTNAIYLDTDNNSRIQASVNNFIDFAPAGTIALRAVNTGVRMASSLPFRLEDGTFAAPSLTFNNDLDTGITKVAGADTLSLVTGGEEALRVAADGYVNVKNDLYVDDKIFADTGSYGGVGQAIPGIGFTDQPETGLMYRVSGNTRYLSLVNNGRNLINVTTSSIGASPTITFNDGNTANIITFSNGFQWTGSGGFIAQAQSLVAHLGQNQNSLQAARIWGSADADGEIGVVVGSRYQDGQGATDATLLRIATDVDATALANTVAKHEFYGDGSAMFLGALEALDGYFSDVVTAGNGANTIRLAHDGSFGRITVSSGSLKLFDNNMTVNAVGLTLNAGRSITTQRVFWSVDHLTLGVSGSDTHGLGIGDTLITGDLEVDGDTYFDGSLLALDGSAAVPSFSFFNDTNTGIFSPSADQMSFSTGGGARFTIAGNSMFGATADAPLIKNQSASSQVVYSFRNDQDTGISADTATGDTLQFYTGGFARWSIEPDGYMLPVVDNSQDIGDESFRVRSLFLGPTSLHIHSSAGETVTPKRYSWGIDTVNNLGNLILQEEGIGTIMEVDDEARVCLGNSILAQDGTLAEPSISFVDDTNTGLYRTASDSLGFVTGGVLRARIGTNFIINANRLRVPGGSRALPSTTTEADLTTGMYYDTSEVGFAVGGLAKLAATANGVLFGNNQIVYDAFSIEALATPETAGYNGEGIIQSYTVPGSGTATYLFHFKTKAGVGATRADVAIDGRLGLGTTGIPGAKLALETNFSSGTQGIQIKNTGTGGSLRPLRILDSANSEQMHIAESGRVRAGNGDEAFPALTFVSDVDTGMYRPASDTLGLVTAGTEAMRVDSSGNVGIGTVTPAGNRLSVVGGNVAIRNASALRWVSSVDADRARIVGDTSENLTFHTGSAATERMRITSAGNIGIGTDTPAADLEISGTSTSGNFDVFPTMRLENKSTTTHSFAGFVLEADNGDVEGALTIDGLGTGLAIDGNSPGVALGTNTAHPLVLYTDFDERIRITSTGDVGIGETIPGAKLDISSGSGSRILRLNRDTYDIYTFRQSSGSGLEIYNDTDTTVELKLEAGNIGIGTTTPTLSSGASSRFVEISGATNPGIAMTNTGGGHQYLTYVSSDDKWKVFDAINTADRFTINSIGNVGINDATPEHILTVEVPSGPNYQGANIHSDGAEAGLSIFNTNSGYSNPFTTATATGFNAGDPLDEDFVGGLFQWGTSTGGLAIIGTANNVNTPGISFHSNQGATSPTRAAFFFNAALTNGATGITSLAATDTLFELFNNNISRFEIRGDGHVGINTSPSSANLQVNNDFWVIGGSNARSLVGDTSTGGQWGGMRWQSSNDQLQILHSGFAGTTGAIEIDSSGNVGIGATTMSAKLHVEDQPAAAGAVTALIRNLRADTGSDDANLDLRAENFRRVRFLSNAGAEDAVLSSDINVGFTMATGGTIALRVDPANQNIAIGTSAVAADAQLDLQRTDGALLLPRLTTTQRDALTAADGMTIYNTTIDRLQVYRNGSWTVEKKLFTDAGDWDSAVANFQNHNSRRAYGWTLDADADHVTRKFCVPDDWDGVSDLTLTIMGSPENGDDLADGETLIWDIEWIRLDPGDFVGDTATTATGTHTQSGAGTDREIHNVDITIDHDAAGNVLSAGSVLTIRANYDKTNSTHSGNAIFWGAWLKYNATE